MKEHDIKEEVLPPKFNIGDKVKVKTLDRDYRYGVYLNPDMLEYCGKEFEIEAYDDKRTRILNKKCDGYAYSLKGVSYWNWSSDMLEKSEDEINNEPVIILSELRDLSVMQKISSDITTVDIAVLPPELPKADISTQTVTFGNIKTTTGTISFKEEKETGFKETYKLNFTVSSLDFKK